MTGVLRSRTRELAEEEAVARLAGAREGMEPSAAEVQRSFARYQSFKAARASRRTAILPPATAWLNFVYGLGTAAAALFVFHLTTQTPFTQPVAVPMPDGPSRPAPPVTPAGASVGAAPELRRFSATIEHAGVVVSAQPGVVYEVEQGQQAVVVLGSDRSSVEGPALVEFQFSSDSVSGWRMVLKRPPSAAPRRVPPRPSSGPKSLQENGSADPIDHPSELSQAPRPAASVAELWTQAARGMREGQRADAEGALQELAGESNPQTRDAAQLALAQLWLSWRDPRAAALLERLASSGASPLIRKRAAELLGAN